MPTYKFYYFPAKGRGETVRMLFHLSGTPFEDIRLAGEEWMKMKPKMPFEQMPVLEVDGKMIPQSGAIARFLARRLNLYGKDEFENAKTDSMAEAAVDFIMPLMKTYSEPSEEKKAEIVHKFQSEQMPKLLTNLEKNVPASGFCVGNTLTLGDIALYNAFDTAAGFKVDVNLTSYPHLKALQSNVANDPKIAKWFKERPQ